MFEKKHCELAVALMSSVAPFYKPALIKLAAPRGSWAVELDFGNSDYLQLICTDNRWDAKWKDFDFPMPVDNGARVSPVELLVASIGQFFNNWDSRISEVPISELLAQLQKQAKLDSVLVWQSAELLYKIAAGSVSDAPQDKRRARLEIAMLNGDIGLFNFDPSTAELQKSLLAFKVALRELGHLPD
jgi:hypothetical protein